MTFVIAAAGTGGHVFPGLAVGEALIDRGVPRSEILFVGGNRLEAAVYPDEGFPFLSVEVRGLQRAFAIRNLGLVGVMRRARDRIVTAMSGRSVKAVLGMGGYVTVPTAMAARQMDLPFFVSEQNARAGLANRLTSRWAHRAFGSFPSTHGLPNAVWAGNPVREPFWRFDREHLRPGALQRYRLDGRESVIGVVGGSLGSDVINRAVAVVAITWEGPHIQILHLTGERFIDEYSSIRPTSGVTWVRQGFETEMADFYAVSDLVVARAGGAVAELTATSTPSILVPGDFGSSGHQNYNARFLSEARAAIALPESDLTRLGVVLAGCLDPAKLKTMRDAARRIAKPQAAHTIADAMIGVAL